MSEFYDNYNRPPENNPDYKDRITRTGERLLWCSVSVH